MPKKETREERRARLIEEETSRLLESYSEGFSNIDLGQLSHYELVEYLMRPSKSDPPLISRDEWLIRKLAETVPLPIPNYKVQDPDRTRGKYRQKFVEFAVNLAPAAFEDLRPLVPVFEGLFARASERNHISIINDLRWQLSDNKLTHDISVPNYERDEDYLWGDLKLTLNAACFSLLMEMPNYSDSIPDDIREYLDKNKTGLQWVIEPVKTYLGPLGRDEKMVPQAFFLLQWKIYQWVEKYGFQKDWLIDYAYYYLNQLKEQPGRAVVDIPVPQTLYSGRTRYHLFTFESDGWLCSDEGENVKEFEARVTREFEEALAQYIEEAGSAFGIHLLKRYTKPPTYENVEWLAHRVMKGWTSEEIVEKFFLAMSADRTRSATGKRAFNSKKRHVENEMRKLKQYGLPW